MRARRIRLVLGALALLAAGEAAAQNAPSPDDLRALRFYVEQGDADAQAAEVRRLQRQFPGWIPPADLAALARRVTPAEEQAVYTLIADDKFADARAEIERLRGLYPDWSPPEDMERLLRLGEAQGTLDAALDAGDSATAARQARDNPDLLRCDRINNAWRLAESQGAAGNKAAAFAGYSAIVGACTNSADIIATIEKADAVATRAELTGLVARARERLPTQAAELAALERRLLAGRGEGTDESAIPPAPREATAATGQRPLPEPEPPVAEAPPAQRRAAAAREPDRTQTRAAPAGTTARTPAATTFGALPRAGDSRMGAVEAAAQREAWAECLALSTAPRSLNVAYQRGWCALNMDRAMEAAALFEAAMSGNLGATVSRDARYGLTLALARLGMSAEAARVASAGDLTPQQRREIERIILDRRAVDAYNRGDYERAIAFLDAIDASYGLRRDLAILRAYAFLNVGRRIRAREEFVRMDLELSTEETRQGLEATEPQASSP